MFLKYAEGGEMLTLQTSIIESFHWSPEQSMETLEGLHLVVGLNKPERKGYSRPVLTKLKTKPQNDPANLK